MSTVTSSRLRVASGAACLALGLLVLVLAASPVRAQGGQTLFGEVRIDSAGADNAGPPSSIVVVLYRDGDGEVGRQSVANRSRYRFINLHKGDYELAVEVDNVEIARTRLVIRELSSSPYGFQQDLVLALKSKTAPAKPGVVSAADVYNRSGENQSLLRKAQEAAEQKRYDDAISLLQRIVEKDKLDFPAWTLLGIVHSVKNSFAEAENAYLSALKAKPTFVIALINLAKLYSAQKNYEAAIGHLSRAVQAQPQSAEANFLLGEVLIQNRQATKAIPYLNEAVKLGRSEAHLHLGWVFNAAGMKDKAAVEYEEFLKKKPDYSDRKRLEDYISTNLKRN
ncbi:MAG TPA: tetratricopeptide repeat protein [Pyrinomonadaceae bacterium]|nr:tetratricopeptide repeat protein [Pyrinomonadaceae bacterium]